MEAEDVKKVTTPKEPGPANTKKSLDIWYPDGSVVLVADETAFRVHTSILALNCEVFRDMTSIPQPQGGNSSEEMYDSCPVLRLGDTAADLEHFLKAIYHRSYFRPGVKTKFPIVAAILRLSTKYLAHDLRQQAIDVFMTVFPSDFDAWSRRSETRLIPHFQGETGALLALYSQTGVRVILPGVYYAAAKRSLSCVLDDIHALPLEELAKQDICSRFVLGREKLRQAELKGVLAFFDPTFARPNCQNSNDTAALQRYAGTALLRTADPEPYQDWCISNPALVGKFIGLCANCCQTIERHVQETDRSIWEAVPSMFGLPDWATLKAEVEVEV